MGVATLFDADVLQVKGRELYNYLLEELPWYRVIYETRGITIRTPRWTCAITSS